MPAAYTQTFRRPFYWKVVKVGVIQSSFIPWRGYFDFVASVDLFVFYDDVQYSKGGWRNRNRIKCHDGTRWLTVPVRHRSLGQRIDEIKIDNSKNWRPKHAMLWTEEYADAPFFNDAETFAKEIASCISPTLTQLNIQLIRSICTYLSISTPTILSSELKLEGARTERLISLLRAVGGTTYLSGPSADSYLEKGRFEEAGIRLEYKSYDYEPYPQLWGPFEGAVTVLDLIANCGPQSKTLMRSTTPNRVVIP